MKAHIFAIGLVALSATAGASLKSEIEAINKPIKAAFMARDVDGFKKVIQPHMTPDFKYTEGDRTMNFDQMIEGIKQGFSMYSKMTHVSMAVLSVKEHGDKGTAVERQAMNGVVKGPDKKDHKTSYVGLSTETYRKVNGEWKMASMSIKMEKMTMDGKPMPMGGPKTPHRS